jgi:hypothetical protein
LLKSRLTETVILKGDTWDENRFEFLKQQNPEGRVAVVDERQQTFIVPVDKTAARKGAAMKKLLYVSGAVFVGSLLGLGCALAIEAARTRFSRLF